jgi:LysR family transcriptional activator of mexEF-oprN operon
VSLLWAAARDGDPGLRWLIGLMAEVFGEKPVR